MIYCINNKFVEVSKIRSLDWGSIPHSSTNKHLPSSLRKVDGNTRLEGAF